MISLFIGLRPESITGFAIALVFMILTGLAFTALGIAMASKMDDMHGFQLIMNFVIFPIFGLSGALFPIDSLPPWVKTLTLLDPLTYGVEGIRYGLLGTTAINPLISFAALGAFTLVMIVFGSYLFKKISI